MTEPDSRGPGSPAQGGLAALGVAAFAIVCCAAFPLLAAVAGGVALATILGVGAGVVAVVLLVGLVVMRVRHRHACERPIADPLQHDDRAASRARSQETAR
jgi:hypothetical protein